MTRLARRQPSYLTTISGLLVAAAAVAASGCVTGPDDQPAEADQAELTALMADGKLPLGMTPSPTPAPEPPPRFCGGGFGGFGGMGEPPPAVDAGVAGGSTGGGMKPPPRTFASSGTAGVMAPGGAAAGAPGGGMAGAAGGGVAGAGGSIGDGGVPSGGSGGTDPSCASVPVGFWRFDDCNTFRTDLFDSSNEGHSAFRNVDLACGTGQEGQDVSFSGVEDMVYVPDQPGFSLSQGVTAAAWVNPKRLGGVQTLVRKRDELNSAFALLLTNTSYQFIVRLKSGRLASVSARAKAGVWTHVAGTYDGTSLLLYVNGAQVAKSKVTGELARGNGPLLVGNDIFQRRFSGDMENVWFNTMAAPPETIMQLTCLHRPAELTVTPLVGPAVQPGTPVSYQVTIANHNSASCGPTTYQLFTGLPPNFSADPQTAFPQVAAGKSTTQVVQVSSSPDTEADTYQLFFEAFPFDGSDFLFASAQYVVAEPTGCHVSTGRELTVRDVSVVDDKVRTGPGGAWSFGKLMERIARTPAQAPDVTEAMFRTFLSPQTINGFVVDPRENMDPLVLSPWPRTAAGKLDLGAAPMRLLAIVNRLDLKDLDHGKAGEGRLVFGVLGPGGFPMEFTVIFEYLLPAHTPAEFKVWADKFHALGALKLGTEEYNAALQAITDSFSTGDKLIDIRTNEIALSFVWQLREFHLSPTSGQMEPATLFLTPDSQFNGTDRLARFINANDTSIVAETHDVPALFENEPFQAGAVFNNIDAWFAPGINNPEARHHFSLNTCNGCHGGETQTRFLQISNRDVGQPAPLSGFLTGESINDPVTGQPRQFSELARRRRLLEATVCPTN